MKPTCEWLRPFLRGMRPLLIPGGLAVTMIVLFRLLSEGSAASQPLWPLLLAGAAFLYLWWLAALLFDLVFVWHRYIRGSALQQRLHRLRKPRKEREKKALDEWKQKHGGGTEATAATS